MCVCKKEFSTGFFRSHNASVRRKSILVRVGVGVVLLPAAATHNRLLQFLHRAGESGLSASHPLQVRRVLRPGGRDGR